MFATFLALAFAGFVVLPILGWVFGLVFRVLGWTLRGFFGLLFAPLCLVGLLFGGIALAAQLIIPLGIAWLVYNMFVADRY